MNEQIDQVATVLPNGTCRVDADRDPMLRDLQVAYDQVHAKKKAAEEELKAITDAYKNRLTSMYQKPVTDPQTGAENGEAPFSKYLVVGTHLVAPLHLGWVVSRKFDGKAFDTAHPGMRDPFYVPSGAWKLERQR